MKSVDHARRGVGVRGVGLGCPWRRCASRRRRARQGRWGFMRHPGGHVQFRVSEDLVKKRRNGEVRTLSMRVIHPSWTQASTSAGAHSFAFQHPLANAPMIPLVPHSWTTRTTVVFSPGLATTQH